MIGLVLTSATRALATSSPVTMTLADEVRALGLRVVPMRRVRIYQKIAVLMGWIITEDHTACWERVSALHITALTPPPQITAAIDQVSKIPGATLYAERLLIDPFVFVERAGEKVCFGYWKTFGFWLVP